MVVEGALEGELEDDHLGYGKHDPAGRNGSNTRNGHRGKTVPTDTGAVRAGCAQAACSGSRAGGDGGGSAAGSGRKVQFHSPCQFIVMRENSRCSICIT